MEAREGTQQRHMPCWVGGAWVHETYTVVQTNTLSIHEVYKYTTDEHDLGDQDGRFQVRTSGPLASPGYSPEGGGRH